MAFNFITLSFHFSVTRKNCISFRKIDFDLRLIFTEHFPKNFWTISRNSSSCLIVFHSSRERTVNSFFYRSKELCNNAIQQHSTFFPFSFFFFFNFHATCSCIIISYFTFVPPAPLILSYFIMLQSGCVICQRLIHKEIARISCYNFTFHTLILLSVSVNYLSHVTYCPLFLRITNI